MFDLTQLGPTRPKYNAQPTSLEVCDHRQKPLKSGNVHSKQDKTYNNKMMKNMLNEFCTLFTFENGVPLMR